MVPLNEEAYDSLLQHRGLGMPQSIVVKGKIFARSPVVNFSKKIPIFLLSIGPRRL